MFNNEKRQNFFNHVNILHLMLRYIIKILFDF